MKNVYMVLDTETAGGFSTANIYDIAWQIIDKSGNVYIERQFINKDVMTDPDKMRDAFYHRKVYTNYIEMLADGVPLLSWEEIRIQFFRDIKNYNVNVLSAYHLGFDMRAFNYTNSSKNMLHNFCKKRGIKLLDIWQIACETILSTKAYIYYARKLGFVKEGTGNIVTNAEKAFAFTSGNWEYIEEHTALEDVKIEREILLHCLRYKKKLPYGKIDKSPWQIVKKAAA